MVIKLACSFPFESLLGESLCNTAKQLVNREWRNMTGDSTLRVGGDKVGVGNVAARLPVTPKYRIMSTRRLSNRHEALNIPRHSPPLKTID